MEPTKIGTMGGSLPSFVDCVDCDVEENAKEIILQVYGKCISIECSSSSTRSVIFVNFPEVYNSSVICLSILSLPSGVS